mgnify:CR=1 FL=1
MDCDEQSTFDYSKACGFVQDHEMQYMSELAEQARKRLLAERAPETTSSAGSIFRLIMIKRSSRESRKPLQRSSQISEVLVVIGIGGSYLGARAAIEISWTQLL